MQQSFLPIITDDNRILGLVSIPNTVFTGLETSMSINGVATPLRNVVPQRANISGVQHPNYMAITVTPSQERSNFQSASWLASFLPYGKWNQQLGISVMVNKETTLLQMLRGVNLSGAASVVLTPPTASNGVHTVEWGSDVNWGEFTHPFIEVNWAALMSVNTGNTSPASISLGAMTSDPSTGKVRVFVVQSDAPVVNEGVLMNTLRFIKLTEGALPKGAYVWPATITNTDGSTATATFTLNNI